MHFYSKNHFQWIFMIKIISNTFFCLTQAKIMELTHLDNVYLGFFFYLAVNKLITDKM